MSIPLWQAVLLGVLQGLTEFLPVSSSAHLVLAQRLLPAFSQPGLLFDVMLHLGTLVAVTLFFRERILSYVRDLLGRDPALRRRSARLALALAAAVAATGAVTVPLRRLALDVEPSLARMGLALVATSLLLLAAQVVGRRRGGSGRSLDEVSLRDAVLVGGCQSLSALFRGLSRSGNTIAVGLFSGLSRQAAAEFSFLLSIPTILAAAVVENLHEYHKTGVLVTSGESLPSYAVGMVTAGVVGYLAVALLLGLVVRNRLWPFVLYCGVLGLALLGAGMR